MSAGEEAGRQAWHGTLWTRLTRAVVGLGDWGSRQGKVPPVPLPSCPLPPFPPPQFLSEPHTNDEPGRAGRAPAPPFAELRRGRPSGAESGLGGQFCDRRLAPPKLWERGAPSPYQKNGKGCLEGFLRSVETDRRGLMFHVERRGDQRREFMSGSPRGTTQEDQQDADIAGSDSGNPIGLADG